MGREVRRVPKDWQHPKNAQGNYIPLLGSSYSRCVAKWDEGAVMWERGFCENYGPGEKWRPRDTDTQGMTFAQWSGERPVPEDYMPDWLESERTHLQMYEDTTEGTPISPVMESPEALARWLADNGASAFADMTASYDAWLRVARGARAPGMMIAGGQMMSGVEVSKVFNG